MRKEQSHHRKLIHKIGLFGPICALALAMSGCGKGQTTARMDLTSNINADVMVSPRTLTERTLILEDLLDQELASASPARAARLQFYKDIAPAVVEAMLEVEMERATVLNYDEALRTKGEVPELLSSRVSALLKRYKTKDMSELAKRVDTTPIDMLFVQSAVESAYGKSAVAKDCHNIFGVHAANDAQRCPGHPILAYYSDYKDSIKRYVLLLNSGSAYKEFRESRSVLRASVGEVGALDSSLLVEGLLPYSERGESYVRQIADGIKADRLDQLYRDYAAKISLN